MDESRAFEQAFRVRQWDDWRDAAVKLDAAVMMLQDRNADMDSKLLKEFEAIKNRLNDLENKVAELSVPKAVMYPETEIKVTDARPKRTTSKNPA